MKLSTYSLKERTGDFETEELKKIASILKIPIENILLPEPETAPGDLHIRYISSLEDQVALQKEEIARLRQRNEELERAITGIRKDSNSGDPSEKTGAAAASMDEENEIKDRDADHPLDYMPAGRSRKKK